MFYFLIGLPNKSVLSEIAKKMTDLDFTVKYKVVTQDGVEHWVVLLIPCQKN